ncbi:MAG: geranylgeranyl reductase family protein [bacterium]|nr:geranylgeranyl reductase family protein [bacterium]
MEREKKRVVLFTTKAQRLDCRFYCYRDWEVAPTMTMYDVAVIGAGPIGNYTAYQLADRGFDVLLLEEDKTVGENVVCTGIIGKEAFERFNIPLDSVLTKIKTLVFVSPSGIRLEYIHPNDLAYIVDRRRFDLGVFQLAKYKGVEVKLGQKVQEIREDKYPARSVILKTDRNRYRARTAVIATGVDYSLQHSVGMGGIKDFLLGAQTIMPVSTSDSTVEIHTGQKIAPGSFAWVVPIGNGKARVGVLTENNPKYWLKQFIENRLRQKIYDTDEIREKPIAFGAIEKSVNSRVLAVGEAAGHIKTSKGGGIFYGLLCSEISAHVLTN